MDYPEDVAGGIFHGGQVFEGAEAVGELHRFESAIMEGPKVGDAMRVSVGERLVYNAYLGNRVDLHPNDGGNVVEVA